MRTKARRYSASVPAATFTSGADCIGLTGDFDGGFVQANVFVSANVGTGQWYTATFKVDGVAQGSPAVAYQASGNVPTITYSTTLRVPHGRHRISVGFGSGTAPSASCVAELSVAELNA